MGNLLLSLLVTCFLMYTAAAHEAVVILGGRYPDGSLVTEVEVWSPYPECGINIKDTPVPFYDLEDSSSVAYFDGNLYACGGQSSTYNITLDNRCYVYSMADNEWSEGPTMKFPFSPADLWLTTVGNSLVAVSRPHTTYMSILTDNEWSEAVPLEYFLGGRIFSMVALDGNHFALLMISLGDSPVRQFIEIINVETASRIAEVWNYGECHNAFLYNDQYSCSMWIHVHEDGSYTQETEVWSLTFQEDFSNPTWSSVYDLPDEIWNDLSLWDTRMAVVDGMMTAVWPNGGVVNYLDGDQWKTETLEIIREDSGVIVVPCP